jgi:hypothetical protein
MRIALPITAALAAVPLLANALPAPAPMPTPPGVPSGSASKDLLAGLTIAPQGPQDGYSRKMFPHWIKISGNCDTREVVLKRDGTDVVTSSSCVATSGSWLSPYDGVTWTSAHDLQIDHLVPLSNAWKVGTPRAERCSALNGTADQSLSVRCSFLDDEPAKGFRK